MREMRLAGMNPLAIARGSVLLFVLCVCSFAADPPLASVVWVDTGPNICTGVVVGKRQQTYLVLTAAHCLYRIESLRVGSVESPWVAEAAVLGGLSGPEVILLVFETPARLRVWPVASRNPEPGTPIQALGVDTDLMAVWLVSGQVSAYIAPEFTDLTGGAMSVQLPVIHGFSGGPLLCRGKVCGILQSRRRDNYSLGAATPASEFREAVRRWRKGKP